MPVKMKNVRLYRADSYHSTSEPNAMNALRPFIGMLFAWLVITLIVFSLAACSDPPEKELCPDDWPETIVFQINDKQRYNHIMDLVEDEHKDFQRILFDTAPYYRMQIEMRRHNTECIPKTTSIQFVSKSLLLHRTDEMVISK